MLRIEHSASIEELNWRGRQVIEVYLISKYLYYFLFLTGRAEANLILLSKYGLGVSFVMFSEFFPEVIFQSRHVFGTYLLSF